MSEIERTTNPPPQLPASQVDRLKEMARAREATQSSERRERPPQRSLSPVTMDAVAAVLDDQGAEYEYDEDGDIHGIWDDGYFYFFTPGTEETNMVQVQGAWERIQSSELFSDLLILGNEWNANQPFPTAFVVLDEDDDTVILHAEYTVDFGPGATFDQLKTVIEDALGGALFLFEAAAEMVDDEGESDADESAGEPVVDD